MITEFRRTVAAYIVWAGLKAASWVGGSVYKDSFGGVLAKGAARAFREQGWEIVRFDPATEPGERPIVAQRFPQ